MRGSDNGFVLYEDMIFNLDAIKNIRREDKSVVMEYKGEKSSVYILRTFDSVGEAQKHVFEIFEQIKGYKVILGKVE